MIDYLLFDMIAGHEIRENLATECQTIRSILANNGLTRKVKTVRIVDKEFERSTKLKKVNYVHISSHATEDNITPIIEEISMDELTSEIKKYLHPLETDDWRVLCLSCCYSQGKAHKLKDKLKNYFTRIYYLEEDEVLYSTSAVAWSMFYYERSRRSLFRRDIRLSRLNAFFERDTLGDVSCSNHRRRR